MAGSGRRRLGGEDGFTLIELLVVGIILTIVLAGLTDLFTSGTNAEVDQNNRVQAQQQARVGLDRFRREARCASGVTLNSASSVTLTLPSWCVRTVLTSNVHVAPGGLTVANSTINVVTTSGFASGSNTISFGNTAYQTTVTCTGTTPTSFTGCAGGDGGPTGGSGQDYLAGAIVTNTTASTATWCVPTSGAGSAQPYSLERFLGSCGAATSGSAFAESLVSNSIFSETVVPAASTCTPATCPTSGGTLGLGPFFYDVTAVCSVGEIPGTLTPSLSFSSGATHEVTISWSTYSCPGGAAASSYNVYGRDSGGLRWLTNTTSFSYTDAGPTTTTTTDNPLHVPSSGSYTINVTSASAFVTDPKTGSYSITFGPSGPVSCTTAGATSFSGCTGGTPADYPQGMTVFSASTSRPPSVILGVTLKVSTRPRKATATSAFTLTDNVALRNSRPF